jgi:[ribosomal protein S18]-alanine N-acetyltransferase
MSSLPTDPPRCVVRTATEDDLDAIERIERASFSDPWSRRSFAELVGRESVVFLVAVSPESGEEGRVERVVGYGIAYHAAGEAELANVAVHEPDRGHGIGARLVRAILQRVRAAGAEECWLEVRASNTAAQQLYRQLAFADVGLRKRYYARPTEDAVVMRRSLRGSE